MTGALGLASLALIGCRRSDADAGYALALGETGASPDIPSPRPTPTLDETLGHIRLARAAEVRTLISVRYDPAYVSLDYPGGDVPDNTGVCADVIIRAYRALDTDLQVAIHEDMRANFQAYPTFWGLTRPDRNIDHRRVLNLETYFNRCGDALAVDLTDAEIEPGDLASWRVGGHLPHIGIASTARDSEGRRLFVHNIGAGPQLEACLDAWPRTGLFRHRPWVS